MQTIFLLSAVVVFLGQDLTTNEQTSSPNSPKQSGKLPEKWIDGTDENEPSIQIHAYNKDLFILRQSKRVHFEAPFMYLIFGNEKAILLDTGAPGLKNAYETVRDIVDQRGKQKGVTFELVVTNTHFHFDHVFNNLQFKDKPNTKLVGIKFMEMKEYFGIKNWPNETAEFDLGDRKLVIIPTPGHHYAHLSFYDPHTQILFTGDTFYPGFLFTFLPDDWDKFRNSISRLVKFSESHPVKHILGCHIEMAAKKRQSFQYGTREHPNERRLELSVNHLKELHKLLIELDDKPKVVVHDDFVIFPAWTTSIFGKVTDENEK